MDHMLLLKMCLVLSPEGFAWTSHVLLRWQTSALVFMVYVLTSSMFDDPDAH